MDLVQPNHGWWVTWGIITIVFVQFCASTTATTTTCSSMGSVNDNRGDQQIHFASIYFDLDHPAKCSGQISQLHFCYYATNFGGFVRDIYDPVHLAAVQIWREDLNTGELYWVHEYMLSQDTSQDNRDDFVCRNETLTPNDYISVKENDIIGAILPNILTQPFPLQLISTNTTALNFGLYLEPLSSSSIKRVTVSRLIRQNGLVLHLSADINSMAQNVCTSPSVGSNIQVSLSNPESVEHYSQYYLNTEKPARCNGTISSVDYCYYGPSQYSNNRRIRHWAAVVALYRSEANGSYRRVSDGILLLKHTPSDPLSPNPQTDVLLNFNCDKYVLNSTMSVQEGDYFGALILNFTDLTLPIGGLDLVSDSSNGYLMMNKSLDPLEEVWDTLNDVLRDVYTSAEGVDLPLSLDGLSLDTDRRILHVYANITPDSDHSDFTATSPATATVSETEIEAHSIVSSTIDHEISTRSPAAIESSPPYIQIIGGVLSGIVIVGIVICIAIVVMVILYKKGRQATFDLTANEAYTEINMQDHHRIDEGDNRSQEIQQSIADADNVPLEQNAAYIVNSSIVAARNMAYENASDFHEYDYID